MADLIHPATHLSVTCTREMELPNELHIRLPDDLSGEEAVVEIFFFTSELHRMNRVATEPISSMLKRLQSTWSSKMSGTKKGKGKGKGTVGAVVSLPNLVDETGEALDPAALRNQDFQTGWQICLQERALLVVVNPPAVTTLSSFPSKAIVCVGKPVAALVTFEFAECVDFSWFFERSPGVFDMVPPSCCSGGALTPTDSMLDCRIKLVAVPRDSTRKGRAVSYYLPCKVQDSMPEPAVLAERSGFLLRRATIEEEDADSLSRDLARVLALSSSSSSPRDFRVLTYNILAEPFATSESAVKHMFPYCARAFLDSEYRLQLVAEELSAYRADVVCLQECDDKAFSGYLEKVMSSIGYRGFYTNKVSRVREGCALFVREGEGGGVRLLGHLSVPLGAVIARRAELNKVLEAKPWAREILVTHLGTVAQLALVQVQSKLVVVANTHLFYHPDAPYVRLLQTDTICMVGRAFVRAVKSWATSGQCSPFVFHLDEWESWLQQPEPLASAVEVAFIFCGDLNSTPETAVCEYLEKGSIASDHEVWDSLDSFRWGTRLGEEEEGAGGAARVAAAEGETPAKLAAEDLPALTNPHGPLISSAGYPPFTNYTGGFKDLLDFIYIEPSRFQVAEVASFPAEDVLRKDTALPSAVFPSDHLAVVVDLRFYNNDHP